MKNFGVISFTQIELRAELFEFIQNNNPNFLHKLCINSTGRSNNDYFNYFINYEEA